MKLSKLNTILILLTCCLCIVMAFLLFQLVQRRSSSTIDTNTDTISDSMNTDTPIAYPTLDPDRTESGALDPGLVEITEGNFSKVQLQGLGLREISIRNTDNETYSIDDPSDILESQEIASGETITIILEGKPPFTVLINNDTEKMLQVFP